MSTPDLARLFSDAGAVAPGLVTLLTLGQGALVARRELSALTKVTPRPLTTRLDVVIPARNEAARIEATLHALLADDSGALRVFVYDDRSTDDTAARVRAIAAHDPRLALIVGDSEPEAGGFGKPLALARAVDALDDDCDLLLFLDADVTLAPGTLGGLVAALERTGGDALSGTPQLLCEGALEHLLVPAFVSLVASRYRPSRVADDGGRDAFLNGQLILIRTAALHEVGGWRAVKGTVLEDVALGRRLKAAGRRLRLADLRHVAATRMYTSWAEIRAGFGKNAVAVFGGAWRCLALAGAGVALAFAPLLGVVLAFALEGPVWVALLLWALVIGLQAGLRGSLGGARWPAAFVPLVYLAVGFILVEAGCKALLGGEISWRGRRYDARRTVDDG